MAVISSWTVCGVVVTVVEGIVILLQRKTDRAGTKALGHLVGVYRP